MITRVITLGLSEDEILAHVLKAFRDDAVTSVVLHKKGAHLRMPDGREVVVGRRPAEVGPEPVGAC